jgi:2-iminobutanoate/2-iminopropanoate deaminase
MTDPITRLATRDAAAPAGHYSQPAGCVPARCPPRPGWRGGWRAPGAPGPRRAGRRWAKPARTVVPVPELHHGYLVEVEAIAVRGG